MHAVIHLLIKRFHLLTVCFKLCIVHFVFVVQRFHRHSDFRGETFLSQMSQYSCIVITERPDQSTYIRWIIKIFLKDWKHDPRALLVIMRCRGSHRDLCLVYWTASQLTKYNGSKILYRNAFVQASDDCHNIHCIGLYTFNNFDSCPF